MDVNCPGGGIPSAGTVGPAVFWDKEQIAGAGLLETPSGQLAAVFYEEINTSPLLEFDVPTTAVYRLTLSAGAEVASALEPPALVVDIDGAIFRHEFHRRELLLEPVTLEVQLEAGPHVLKVGMSGDSYEGCVSDAFSMDANVYVASIALEPLYQCGDGPLLSVPPGTCPPAVLVATADAPATPPLDWQIEKAAFGAFTLPTAGAPMCVVRTEVGAELVLGNDGAAVYAPSLLMSEASSQTATVRVVENGSVVDRVVTFYDADVWLHPGYGRRVPFSFTATMDVASPVVARVAIPEMTWARLRCGGAPFTGHVAVTVSREQTHVVPHEWDEAEAGRGSLWVQFPALTEGDVVSGAVYIDTVNNMALGEEDGAALWAASGYEVVNHMNVDDVGGAADSVDAARSFYAPDASQTGVPVLHVTSVAGGIGNAAQFFWDTAQGQSTCMSLGDENRDGFIDDTSADGVRLGEALSAATATVWMNPGAQPSGVVYGLGYPGPPEGEEGASRLTLNYQADANVILTARGEPVSAPAQVVAEDFEDEVVVASRVRFSNANNAATAMDIFRDGIDTGASVDEEIDASWPPLTLAAPSRQFILGCDEKLFNEGVFEGVIDEFRYTEVDRSDGFLFYEAALSDADALTLSPTEFR